MNNMNHDLPSPSRIVWLDIVRLTAMLMVIGVHCIDPFYISPTLGTLPEYKFRASVYGSLFRPSVPLFAMMTGLLLLPVSQQPLGVFYKKRIFRVLFPFLIWSVLYNLFPWFTGVVGLPKSIIGDFFCYVQGNESQSFSDSLKDIAMIPFNFSFKENHMWYIYLLIGLYLYMPFFSAWIDKADRKMKQTYLWIWVISLFLPYMGEYISHSLANITKCGFGIYMVHYFLVGPAFLLIGNFNLPIPLQVPVMAILIFLCAWGFTALMYRILGRKARWIMG